MIWVPSAGTNSTLFVDFKMRIQTSYFVTFCSLTLDSSHDSQSILPSSRTFYRSGASIMFNNRMQMRRSYSDPESLAPLYFRYGTRAGSNHSHQVDCNLTSSYTEIICPDRTSCIAGKARRSQLTAPPKNWTMLDLHPNSLGALFSAFLNSSMVELDGQHYW